MKITVKTNDGRILGTPDIRCQKITHFEYTLGWKVFMNGKKYPKKRGFFYTLQNRSDCLKLFMAEILGMDYSKYQKMEVKTA